MLSPFRALLGTQLKIEFGQRGLSEKLGLGRSSRSAYVYLVLMVLAFFPLIGMLYQLGDGIAAQSIAMSQPGLPVVLAVMLGQFLVLVVGVSALLSSLYYSSDVEMLQSMPLTGRQILGAKVLVAYIAEIVFSSVVAIPFFIPLGRRLGGPIFWVMAALVNLAIPAIPLALGLLFTVLIMRSTKGVRHRDMFRVVFGLVFFLLVMAFQYFNTNMINHGPEAMMQALMEPNGLVQVVSGYYPPLTWAAWALTGWNAGKGLTGALAFVGGSLLILLFIASFTQGWFLGGLGKDVGKASARQSGRVAVTRKDRGAGALGRGDGASVVAKPGKGRFSQDKTPLHAVFLRDHRVLIRTPNFLLVVLTNMAIIPIMLVFSAIGGNDLFAMLGSSVRSDALLLIMVAIQGGISSMNQVSSTAISREGQTFWLSKMIPVLPRVQVRAKLRYCIMVSAAQLATLLGAGAFIAHMDPYHLAIAAVLGMLASWPVSALCIINDLYSPRLSWTEPHQAMKGNFATLGAMLLCGVYLLVTGFAVKLIYEAGLGGLPLYLIVAAIAAGTGLPIQKYMENLADAKYLSIEV